MVGTHHVGLLSNRYDVPDNARLGTCGPAEGRRDDSSLVEKPRGAPTVPVVCVLTGSSTMWNSAVMPLEQKVLARSSVGHRGQKQSYAPLCTREAKISILTGN